MVRSAGLKAAFFALALIIAFSRVYLSEHFFLDMYAGPLVGVCCAMAVSELLERQRSRPGRQWMERSLPIRWTRAETH